MASYTATTTQDTGWFNEPNILGTTILKRKVTIEGRYPYTGGTPWAPFASAAQLPILPAIDEPTTSLVSVRASYTLFSQSVSGAYLPKYSADLASGADDTPASGATIIAPGRFYVFIDPNTGKWVQRVAPPASLGSTYVLTNPFLAINIELIFKLPQTVT